LPTAEDLYQDGVERYNQGEWAGAEQFFRRALALDPKHADAQNDLGNALFAQGDFEGAEKWYLSTMELDPEHAEAHYNLGSLHYERGSFGEATTRIRRSLLLDSRHPQAHAAHKTLGEVLLQHQDFEEAVKSFEAAVALDEEDASAHLLLGRAYHACGRLKDAEAAIRTAGTVAPSREQLFALAQARRLGRPGTVVSKIGKISKLLLIFGGLVLGCIKTNFCKKICV
jgi:Flp pilus assembly protein TadD